MILKTFQNALLVVYGLGLCVWSGNIMLGSGGNWFAGAVPVAGWFYTLFSFDIGRSAFAMNVALWLVCLAAVVVLRGVPKQ